MNIAARMNLQKGVTQNKRNIWTDYSIENKLDAYIMKRNEMNNKENQKLRKEEQKRLFEKEMDKRVKQQVDQLLNKAFNDLIKELF